MARLGKRGSGASLTNGTGAWAGPKSRGGFRKLRSKGWTCSLGRAFWLHVGYGPLRSGGSEEARKETRIFLGTGRKMAWDRGWGGVGEWWGVGWREMRKNEQNLGAGWMGATEIAIEAQRCSG